MPGGEDRQPRSLQELTDLVEELAGRQATADGLIQEIATIVAELAATPKPDAVRPWLTEDDAELAVDRLDLLARWLREVWVHYPGHEGTRPLPPCWARHPWAVEELWTARGAYREATGAKGSYARLSDWLDRTRPGVARRLADRLGTCDVHRHATSDGRTSEDPDLSVTTDDLSNLAYTWTRDRSVLPSTTQTT